MDKTLHHNIHIVHSLYVYENIILFQIVFLLASAAAVPVQVAPDGYGPSAVPYGPSPPSYAARPEPPRAYKVQPAYPEVEEEEKFEPQPYKYEYGVQDDYSKAAFAKSETQNEVGAVTGSYKVRETLRRFNAVHSALSCCRLTCLMVVSRL